jgi:CheY-like chemotaxis protein
MSSEETIVVGKDATTRALLCSAFARQGLRARVALDGIAALELCRQRPPSTLIIEAQTEGLSLSELLAALRTQTRLSRIGVILLGSEPSPDPAQRLVALPLPAFGKDVVSLSRFMSVETPQGVLSLGDYNVLSFVRALHTAQIQCQLIFRRPPPTKLPEAHITITHNEISCRAGHLQGKSAFNRIAVWRRAQVIWRLDVSTISPQPEEILPPGAFSEAAQYLAEVQSLLSTMPPDDIPLILYPEKRPPASKVPGEVNTILSLCGAGMSLDALLEEVPFRVLDSLRILRRLFDLGILAKTSTVPSSTHSGEHGEEPVRARPIVVLTRPPGEPDDAPAPPRNTWSAPSVEEEELKALEERVARALEEDGDELDEQRPPIDSSFEEFETPQVPVSTVTVSNFETPHATVRVVSKHSSEQEPMLNLEQEYQNTLDDDGYPRDTPVEGVPLPPKTRRWKLSKKKE